MQRYRLNINLAGVGSAGEIVYADADIHAVWIEKGYLVAEESEVVLDGYGVIVDADEHTLDGV